MALQKDYNFNSINLTYWKINELIINKSIKCKLAGYINREQRLNYENGYFILLYFEFQIENISNTNNYLNIYEYIYENIKLNDNFIDSINIIE